MDPSDPYQRRSIFPEPEPGEQRQIPPQRPSRTIRQDQPVARYREGPGPAAQGGPSRRLMIGLGAGGLMLLLIGGFVAASVLGPADEPALAAASPSTTPQQSISPTPTVEPTMTPSPSPTPVPTPAGPPQDIAVGAWATVAVEELNVRSGAGTEATSNYLLVRGAVVHIAEGPLIVADLNWYRIASLGGAVGWVTSGWVAEPFLTTLVEDPTLIRCGEVTRSVFDIVDGVPTPHDPITIGDLALPVAAFSELSLGAIELLRGVDREACFTAQVGSDGLPVVSAQLSVGACGHAVSEGAFFRIRPAAGQDAPVEAQVKDPAVVHPTILDGGPPDDRKSSNIQAVVAMMASGADASGCIYLNVTEDAGGVVADRSVSTSQCSIVQEYNADSIWLSPAAGGETIWIKLTSQGSPTEFQLGVPVPVFVSAYAHDQGRDAYAHQGFDPDCGA